MQQLATPFPSTSFPKSEIKVLLLERVAQSAIDALVKEEFQVETRDKMTEDELIAAIPGVHILGVRSKTKVTAKVLKSASKLLAIGCFCIGTDQVDLSAAANCGVAVFNAPFANTRSVAELCICEMIALARQLCDRTTECHKGVWNKQSSGCYELRGKILCIIGYGHVGSQLSILAEAMGMRVKFFDVVPKLAISLAEPCDTMEEALKDADFVSLHVPATPETVNLIAAKEIAQMKRGAYLLNASRGQVVNLDHAVEALKSGHLSGGAFDVFPHEPATAEPFKCPLQGMKNIILTPHIGGSTEEAQVAIGKEVAAKLISFINHGSSLGSVNIPELCLPPNNNIETHRILNIHKNVPGVLRDINAILGDYNVIAQLLMTMEQVGYLIVDLDAGVSLEVREKISELKSNIKTRLLY